MTGRRAQTPRELMAPAPLERGITRRTAIAVGAAYGGSLIWPWGGTAARRGGTGASSRHPKSNRLQAVGSGPSGSRSFLDQVAKGNGALSDGRDASTTYVLGYTAPFALSRIRLAYTNQWNLQYSEAPGPNAITVRASIEYPVDSGRLHQATVNGRSRWVVKPGTIVVTDPVAGAKIPHGAQYRVRTYVSVARRGEKWPLSFPAMRGTSFHALGPHEGKIAGKNVTMTNVGWIFDTGMPYGPHAILAPSTRPGILLVGDSIMHGYNNLAFAGADTVPNYYGFGAVACRGHGYVQASFDADGASQFIGATYMDTNTTRGPLAHRLRLLAAGFCRHAIVMYGRNDLTSNDNAPGTYTLSQLQSSLLGVWEVLAGKGMHVWACTILPYTTSTDNWATLANQTTESVNSQRVSLNDWIRAGAPINPRTGTPVAVGTAGALLAGSRGHTLAGHFETADAVESARNSGLWKANGHPNHLTSGGIHPTGAADKLLAATIDLEVLVSDYRRHPHHRPATGTRAAQPGPALHLSA